MNRDGVGKIDGIGHERASCRERWRRDPTIPPPIARNPIAMPQASSTAFGDVGAELD
jgi:hypothetical protein